MAYVCDRCLGKDANKVSVIFRKKKSKEPNSKDRHMLDVGMDLCEACINEFLKAFGKFKFRWLKEADEPDDKE